MKAASMVFALSGERENEKPLRTLVRAEAIRPPAWHPVWSNRNERTSSFFLATRSYGLRIVGVGASRAFVAGPAYSRP